MEFDDYVKAVPPNKTIVNWWDLHHRYKTRLDRPFIEEVINNALSKVTGKFIYLARATGINRKAIPKYLNGNRAVPLANLKKLMNYLDIPLEKASSKIIEIGKLKPHLPFNILLA